MKITKLRVKAVCRINKMADQVWYFVRRVRFIAPNLFINLIFPCKPVTKRHTASIFQHNSLSENVFSNLEKVDFLKSIKQHNKDKNHHLRFRPKCQRLRKRQSDVSQAYVTLKCRARKVKLGTRILSGISFQCIWKYKVNKQYSHL